MSAPTFQEIKETIDALGKAHHDFREANDKSIAALKSGNETLAREFGEKADKFNKEVGTLSDLAKKMSMQIEMQNERIEELEARASNPGKTAAVKRQDEYKEAFVDWVRNKGQGPLQEQKLPPAIPAGLPSELLDRRPDIREAEQTLAAATANIGEAKALLFPQISLTGAYGYTSTELDTLFDGPSKAWNILGNLVQPIFNYGKNKRRVEVTESRQRQQLYDYERTILNAFRETEDALVTYRKTGEMSQAQAGRVAAERKVLELAELRYRGGVAAYLEVLDAQRSLFGAEMDEAQTVGTHLVSLVQLYKALGGGWPAEPETASAAEKP